MRKGREEGASLLNLHPCSCFFYILTSSISLLRQHCCIGLGELCKPTMGTKMKVKGICKGFNKYISQMFVVKEHEMQIGYPTDVKHVAHIGWDSQSSNAPSWMNEFKTTSDFSSTSLNNLCDDPSWSSQDFEHSMRPNQQGSDQNSKDESTTTRTTTTTTTTTEDLPNAPTKQKRKKIKSSFSLKKSSSSTTSRSSSTTKLQPKTSFATSSMISEVETTVPVLATRSNKLGLL